MESDIGKDIEHTLFQVALIWVFVKTVRRQMGRLEEAIVWAVYGAAGALLATAIWFQGLGPSDPTYVNGVQTGSTGGNEAGMWLLVLVCAVVGALLSLMTWEGAQIRRTRREYRRQLGRAARADQRSMEQEQWRHKALQ